MIIYFLTCSILSALYILYMSTIHYFSYAFISKPISIITMNNVTRRIIYFLIYASFFLPFCFNHISTSGFFELLFQNFIFCFQLYPKCEEIMFYTASDSYNWHLLNKINNKNIYQNKNKNNQKYVLFHFPHLYSLFSVDH